MADALTREQAFRLNPIISPVNAQDTISNCASLIEEIGHTLANADAAEDHRNIHMLTGAISAALNFELGVRHV